MPLLLYNEGISLSLNILNCHLTRLQSVSLVWARSARCSGTSCFNNTSLKFQVFGLSKRQPWYQRARSIITPPHFITTRILKHRYWFSSMSRKGNKSQWHLHYIRYIFHEHSNTSVDWSLLFLPYLLAVSKASKNPYKAKALPLLENENKTSKIYF